ncbi:MAG: hypothetical protein LBE91_07335 [Tannerella sp.]|jgi:hypothetical protein|nr:hypothetical protein [Tannerella sp.]
MKRRIIFFWAVVFASIGLTTYTESPYREKPATIGVYYFDGWAGQNEPWAKNAPSHLTKRFVEEFSGREPVWGWRDDDLAIMERQEDQGSSFQVTTSYK